MLENFQVAGYQIVSNIVDKSGCRRLIDDLAEIAEPSHGRGGVRDLLNVCPAVRELAVSPALLRLVESALGRSGFAVRGILFDKTPKTNWKVAWHQDVTVAVREPAEVSGYGPWSLKSGIHHAQAPRNILDGMVALRVHLDPCGSDNGPVRVLPGTHGQGKLAPASIDRARVDREPVECLADVGDVLLMRPLLLHASSAATSPARRRVVHIEYASNELPHPLVWRERWPEV